MIDLTVTDPSMAALAQRLLARALRANQPGRLRVRGRSMEPLIRGGDWVEILPPAAARRGSIVLARTATGDLVCHRILRQAGGRVWLAGDRSSTVEEHFPESLLGVVARVERGGQVRSLGGCWAAVLDHLEARLHLLTWRHGRSLARLVLDAFRRTILELRSLAWVAPS